MRPGKPNCRGRLSTVDLLALTSLDELFQGLLTNRSVFKFLAFFGIFWHFLAFFGISGIFCHFLVFLTFLAFFGFVAVSAAL